MSIGREQVQVGMKVVDANGVTVGKVQEVRDDEFRVERLLKPPITLPYTAIRTISGPDIELLVPARDLGEP